MSISHSVADASCASQPEPMPVTKLIKFAPREDRRSSLQPGETLPAAGAVPLEPPEEVYIFQARATIVIATDLLEVTTATVREPRVNSCQRAIRSGQAVNERDTRGPPLRPDARSATDNSRIVERGRNGGECIRVEAHVRVDEREVRAAGDRRASIAHGCDNTGATGATWQARSRARVAVRSVDPLSATITSTRSASAE